MLRSVLRTAVHRTPIRGMTTSTTPPKVPIHRLPLAKPTLQGSLSALKLEPEPSAQRRNTTFDTTSRGVWARTLPLWTEWPLRITKEEALELGVDVDKGQGVSVEDVLRRWDPVDVESTEENGLRVASSAHRLKLEPVILGVAEAARKEVLPHLDAGSPDLEADTQDPAAIALADILSGRKILSNDEYVPWSTRYCGHQFGVWAGQLGDGRAMSVIETESATGGRCEIQIKGGGRTPFSRQADGLAVLRSGVREYLGCEAIAALGIPTTRSLAILTSPVIVIREQGPEPSSLVARLAPSFIRIGHFEAMNPGEAGRNTRTLFLGGNWANNEEPVDPNDPLGGHGNLEGMRELVMWVKNEIMGMGDKSIKEWFLEVVRLNAKTTALWQVYGFMHGVLNTDNISVLGLTIDYGPYAFMDVWDQNHICNHSDPTGLYSYKNQPSRVLFALDSLASSLLPILGYEAKNGSAPSDGWGAAASKDDVRAWDEAGLAAIEGWNEVFNNTLKKEESSAWAKRFGLKTVQSSDERDIVRDLLSLLNAHNGDFGSSFRQLCFFDPAKESEEGYVRSFAKRWVAAAAGDQPSDSISRAEEALGAWLRVYAKRVMDPEEQAAWKESGENRAQAMKNANPRFILRQWVLEDTIAKMDAAVKKGDIPEARKVLARVLDMATNPFKPYGEDETGVVSSCSTDPEESERTRLAGVGPRTMLGFQCSCSS